MNIHIQTEWLTPSGNTRNVPVYSTTVQNTFLGLTRTFRGADRGHVTGRASAQLQRWSEQETRQKAAAAKQDAIERGEAETASLDADAREAIEAVSNLLHATLAVDDRIDWNELRDSRTAEPFLFLEPMPAPPDTRPRQIGVQYGDHPAAPWYVSFWPGARTGWEARCAAVDAENRRLREQLQASHQAEVARCESLQAAHDVATHAWHQRRAAANAKYDAECAAFAEVQRGHNAKVERFKHAFEQGVPQAVAEYLRGVFERSDYPACFTVRHSVDFEPTSKHAAVELDIPAQDDFPSVSGFVYTRSKREAKATVLKKKEQADLYQSALAQVVLRTLHEIFEADYAAVVREASASAFVTALDRSTGKERRTCWIAISATRELFLGLDLGRVDPVSCAKTLSVSSITAR